MRIVIFNPIPDHVMDIVYKYMPAFSEFVKEMREAGYNPRSNDYGSSSDSFTVMAAGVLLTFGRAEWFTGGGG